MAERKLSNRNKRHKMHVENGYHLTVARGLGAVSHIWGVDRLSLPLPVNRLPARTETEEFGERSDRGGAYAEFFFSRSSGVCSQAKSAAKNMGDVRTNSSILIKPSFT